MNTLKKKYKILIAGQEGMVGSAIYKLLKKKKINIIECKRRDLDFTNYDRVSLFFKKNKPNIVINAAGKVGGILDNSRYPIEYLNKNISIGLNIVNLSYKFNVEKLINLGSVCIYPKESKIPIKEEYLLTKKLEQTNEAYALAKITILKLCQFYKEKKKKDFITLLPANLYGENDNFDLDSSHVMPALIRKFYEAKLKNKNYVKIWGSGKATREFLHVDDLAKAVFFLIQKNIKYNYLNIGSGETISIKQLAVYIKKISNFNGKIIFDTSKPDGQRKRSIDSSKIKNLGWKNDIKLKDGIKKLYNNYIKN